MELAKASAVYAAPVPLRLILAITFIWAGLGKVMSTTPVQGEKAALLANMGYDFPSASTTPTPETPPALVPEIEPEAAPDAVPQPDPEAVQIPASQEELSGLVPLMRLARQNQTPAPPPSADTSVETPALEAAESASALPQPRFAAADFPEPIEVRSLHNLALLTYTAAHPTPREDGTIPPPIWPEWAARDHWPITMAWVAAITEIAAGVLVLVGLLTRIAALSLAAVMATAAWLTQFGFAVQTGDTFMGFLPAYGLWDIHAWQPLLWQLALLCAAISLTLAGPGAFAIDRVGGSNDDDDDDLDDD